MGGSMDRMLTGEPRGGGDFVQIKVGRGQSAPGRRTPPATTREERKGRAWSMTRRDTNNVSHAHALLLLSGWQIYLSSGPNPPLKQK